MVINSDVVRLKCKLLEGLKVGRELCNVKRKGPKTWLRKAASALLMSLNVIL